jgi:hypothetical protein
MHKQRVFRLFGDYSSYSAEYDEINDPDLYPEDISEEVSETSEEEEADKDENKRLATPYLVWMAMFTIVPWASCSITPSRTPSPARSP